MLALIVGMLGKKTLVCCSQNRRLLDRLRFGHFGTGGPSDLTS
jgi:hypothetical protein